MEKAFEKPYMKVVCFDTESVVTTSAVNINYNVIDAQNYLYGDGSSTGVSGANNTTLRDVSSLGFNK